MSRFGTSLALAVAIASSAAGCSDKNVRKDEEMKSNEEQTGDSLQTVSLQQGTVGHVAGHSVGVMSVTAERVKLSIWRDEVEGERDVVLSVGDVVDIGPERWKVVRLEPGSEDPHAVIAPASDPQ